MGWSAASHQLKATSGNGAPAKKNDKKKLLFFLVGIFRISLKLLSY